MRRDLNQNEHAKAPDSAELRALAWLERASLPISALEDPDLAGELLEVLSRKLDGTPAAPDYFSRRRRVMHRVLGYAVRKRRLAVNPLSKANLPGGWSAPRQPEDVAIRDRSAGPTSSPTCSPSSVTSDTARGRASSRTSAACSTR